MLAVLIDADNAQPSVTEALMGEIAKFGIAGVKRIYGDWTTPNLSGWKSIVLDTFNGTIESIVWMGLFVTVADSGVTGLLHKSNLPEDFMACFTVGQKIPVTIKTIHTERHQIELVQA